MRSLYNLAVALLASAVGTTLAIPVIRVQPGDKDDLIITKENTINATTPAPLDNSTSSDRIASTARLPLSLVNNFGGGTINAYVTGLDASNRLVMLQPNGRYYYPSARPGDVIPQIVNANVAIPLGGKGSETKIILPGYISSARIWFAEGELKFYTVYSSASGGPSLVEPSAVSPSDPSANVNWGFVELTNIENGGLYANISYVDFVGLVLGMSLKSADNSLQVAQGLRPNAVSQLCSKLKAQGAKDRQPWGDLCMVGSSGAPLRVLAPNNYVASNPAGFGNYWTKYIDDVWTAYTSKDLTVNTQAAAGHVNCRVKNGRLVCNGDNRGYNKPTAGDIFGCNSGPFAIQAGDNDVHRAIVPRLCAAFTRTTLLVEGGHMQPGLGSKHYYTADPTNWYSKFIHELEVDGKGYAFSYDDVNPDGENQSGVVAHPNPQLLTIVVGGPLSGSW